MMGRVDRARRNRNAIRRDLRARGLDTSPELADVLGFADGLLDHLDDEEKLGRVGSAIVAQAGIPIDDLAGGVALAQVLLQVAAGDQDEEVVRAAEE